MATTSAASPISHSGQVLSCSVTFQFALDPSEQQRILLAKCAGARRFTVNHHLARVKANLDVRSAEREALTEGTRAEEPTASLSWSAFSFINEFNAWKNGKTDDSPHNEDGTQGLQWRHELPGDVFECASVDAARALENFSVSRRGERCGTPVGFPRFQAKGKVRPSFRLRNRATPGQAPTSQPVRFSDPVHLRLPKFGPVKLFGSTRQVRRMIDAGRFHVYSATLSERAGRWTVSLTGVAAEFHQAERSRTNRHTVPVGVDRGITSFAVAADANGIPFEIFEGVKTFREAQRTLKAANQALARTTLGSQGRQRARARLGHDAPKGRQHPTAPDPPGFSVTRDESPGPRDRVPQRRRNGQEPTPGPVHLGRRHGRTLPPDPLQGQMVRGRGSSGRPVLPIVQDLFGLRRGQERTQSVAEDLLVWLL